MRLKPTKSVWLDDITGFVIKGCSLIFSPVLKQIFYLILSLQHFPTPWQQAAIVPALQKGSSSLLVIVVLFISIEISKPLEISV